MGMNAGSGPYGGPYGQSASQGLAVAGLAPQLQNKPGLPNSPVQFNLDKKPQPMHGIPGMVCISSDSCMSTCKLKEFYKLS